MKLLPLLQLPRAAFNAACRLVVSPAISVSAIFVGVVSLPTPCSATSLQTQINNFISAHSGNPGPLTCTLTAGTYNSSIIAINLSGVSFPNGLTIDGTNVHVVMTSTQNNFKEAITLSSCDGITIKNLTVDYNPLPFTQGTVSQVNTNPSGQITSILLSPDSGSQWAAPPSAAGRVWAVDSSLNLAFNTATYNYNSSQAQSGKYLLTLNNPLSNDSLAVGDKISIPLSVGAHGIYFKSCTNCGLNGVQLYSAPGIAVFDQGSSGSSFNSVSVIPEPGTSNIRSSNADGIHVQDCLNGPTITNCDIEYAGDDGLVCHSALGLITQAVTNSNTVEIATAFAATYDYFPGDTIGFFPNGGTGAYFTATISSIVQNTNVSPPAGFGYVYDITLASGQLVTVGSNSWTQDQTRASAGFVIQNSKVANTRARGIFARGLNGSILDNNISYTAMAGIGSMAMAASDFEGDFSQNILIDGNSVTNANYRPNPGDNLAGAISVTVNLQAPGSTGSGSYSWGSVSGHTGATITDNTVDWSRGPYLHLHGGKTWEVSGNTFSDPQQLTDPTQNKFGVDENCVVWLDAVNTVTFGDQGANTVKNAGASNDGNVGKSSTVTNITGLSTFIDE